MRPSCIGGLLLYVVLLGCATGPGTGAHQVTLDLEHERYAPGDTLVARLHNASRRSIGYNLCLGSLEYWTGDEWRRFGWLRLCANVLDVLPPGDQVPYREVVEPAWEPGVYRLVLPIELLRRGVWVEVISDTFRVEP